MLSTPSCPWVLSMASTEDLCSAQSPCHAVRISEHVYWVGAIDWTIRDFHGYLTERGTTYNAFLILADKVTLIDTVKAPFRGELLARITSLIDPKRIDYLVSNHAEMDHSGCLPDLIHMVQPEKVFASPLGVKALTDHFHLREALTPVKDGDTVNLGNLHLTFVETRMVHWPDSMFTYLAEDGVLFSNDGFGMHLATSERFDDEVDGAELERQAAKYFANILLPFSPIIAKLLEKVNGLQLDLRLIAPDHGPIWRTDYHNVLAWYARWATQQRRNSAVLVYDTMWQSTSKMAQAIAEGLVDGGTSTRLLPLGSSHRSDVATEILDAGALLVGTPTLNNNIFPTVADVLTYLKGLKPRNVRGVAFGSFGWSGEAVGHVNEFLTAMNVALLSEGLKVKYVPDTAALAQCFALGQHVAHALQEQAIDKKWGVSS